MIVPAIKMNAEAPETIPKSGASGARGNLNDGSHRDATARVLVSAAPLR
jgi:hypothetical protein